MEWRRAQLAAFIVIVVALPLVIIGLVATLSIRAAVVGIPLLIVAGPALFAGVRAYLEPSAVQRRRRLLVVSYVLASALTALTLAVAVLTLGDLDEPSDIAWGVMLVSWAVLAWLSVALSRSAKGVSHESRDLAV